MGRSSRSIDREIAMKILYARELGGQATPKDVLIMSDEKDNLRQKDIIFIEQIVSGVETGLDDLDETVSRYLVNWEIERISVVDLIILRIALFELKNVSNTPVNASINEAIELAKGYGGDKSFAFINGILGSFVRSELSDNSPKKDIVQEDLI